MYNQTKEIKIEIIINYEYDSELKAIKEIIKQLTDLDKLKELNVKEN